MGVWDFVCSRDDGTKGKARVKSLPPPKFIENRSVLAEPYLAVPRRDVVRYSVSEDML